MAMIQLPKKTPTFQCVSKFKYNSKMNNLRLLATKATVVYLHKFLGETKKKDK